jgi:uncharacterized caspase-like protein
VPSRIALVIGNATYLDAPLANSVNDAHLIAASLKQVGFKVTEYANLDLDHLRKAIQAFGDQLTAAGEQRAGLVYYSGHGVQAGGHNYLIPVSASIHKEADLELQAVEASALLRQMEGAGAGVNIVVLDACRNNPFQSRTRSLSKGLAQMKAGEGEFFLAYATAPDTEAQDGSGANSPYAKALAAAIALPGIGIEEAFKRVRAQVLKESDNQQQPWESSSLLTSFYFKPEMAPVQRAQEAPGPYPSATASTDPPPLTGAALVVWAMAFGIHPRPAHGQDGAQMLRDESECHSWAVSVSGYDPMDPDSKVGSDQAKNGQEEYEKDARSCLLRHGYKLK